MNSVSNDGNAGSDGGTPRRRNVFIGVLLAISLAPWIVIAVLLRIAVGEQVEGAFFYASFVGALSFVLTGPLAGIVLMRDAVMRFREFCWIFWGVSLPILSFQVFATPASVMPLLIVGASSNLPLEFVLSAIWAIGFYTCYFMILYRLAHIGRRLPMIAVAATLSCASVALFAFLILRAP